MDIVMEYSIRSLNEATSLADFRTLMASVGRGFFGLDHEGTFVLLLLDKSNAYHLPCIVPPLRLMSKTGHIFASILSGRLIMKISFLLGGLHTTRIAGHGIDDVL
jgi:hypothetical protein